MADGSVKLMASMNTTARAGSKLPGLPFRHPVHHPVGNRGNGLLRDLRPVDLLQLRGDLPVGEALLAESEMTISSTPVSRRCRLATIFGSKLESRSRGTDISTGPPR